MIKFIHQLFNPHCQHCADERKEQREYDKERAICLSCETLERENARLVRENERLIDLVINAASAPKIVEEKIDTRELKPINTRSPFMPSAVRRQILEKESRHQMELAKAAPKPDSKVAVKVDAELKELELELDSVRQERESQQA